MKHSKKGFSLLELVVTLVIISLVATLGMPSFQGALRSSRLTSSINELSTALGTARSEAIKQNRSVTVCRKASASSTACKSVASTDGWEVGWFVFVEGTTGTVGVIDGTSTNKGDAADCAAGNDCILIDHEALPTNTLTLRPSGTNATNRVTYAPSGLVSNFGAAGTSFYLCDISSSSTPQPGTSRVLILNAIGRTRMAGDANNDGIPELTPTPPVTNINTCTP